MSDSAITFENVSKRFKKGQIYDSLRDLLPALTKKAFARSGERELKKNEFWALNNISFDVKKGESVGIIGHNGAGKSTMLKHLSGIMQPTKGTITVNGRLSALIEVGAGFHPDLTGRENIFLNGTILGMSRAEIRRKLDEIIDFSGLEDFIDTPVKRYSSGMHARLGFSVAAHLEPDILVVDEVLSVGDYLFQNKGLEKMRSILEGGATVLFVSHNVKAVSSLCKRALLLDHGSLLMDGPSQEVINCYFEKSAAGNGQDPDKEVAITSMAIRNDSGRQVSYKEGSTVQLEVEVTGRASCDNLSLSLGFVDDNHYRIFDTSSQRLTGKPFSIRPGEAKKFVFELQLNLGPGSYHYGTYIYRYDTQHMYDLSSVKTLFIESDRDARGAANLYPRLVEVE
ncbi:ABC transporter ATP-binding protein [Geotalea uraniireducens]|uniref:ABC transporter ATP-binding protein n=1 Tax=Geotalea uraniireducens TaxID=351604 RepID=A0ABM8EKF4_9BACT|nr:ABC transporter ATP-binding protein [Geotalea uraniireducens]BDV43041.1 ABC transporter ATP-binding protein [Geotalea uraniireducens]